MLVLAGCTPTPAPEATTPPITKPTPESTPSEIPLDAPTSRLGLDCDDLLSEADADAIVPKAAFRPDPVADIYETSAALPENYALLSAGGVVCDWSPVAGIAGNTGNPQGYTGIHIALLPAAAAEWKAFQASGYAPPEFYCFNDDLRGDCIFTALINDNWIEISISGAYPGTKETDAKFTKRVRPFVDEIEAIVAAAPAPEPLWVHSAADALPATCAEIISEGDVRKLSGITAKFTYAQDDSFVGLQRTAANKIAGQLNCQWISGYEGPGIGGVIALPGGQWALEQSNGYDSTSGAATPLTVTGIEAPDAAWSRCESSKNNCYVDLLIGGNWYQLEAWRPFDEPSTGWVVAGDRLEFLTHAAEVVAANVSN